MTLPRPVWASLVLVAAVHLLTTPAVLSVSDHVEVLFTAERLAEHGTLSLTDGPADHLRELPWVLGRPGLPLRTRHLPMAALTLSPLVAVEQAVHCHRPQKLGPLTRLHGHLFVWTGLLLLARAVLARTGQVSSAVATVLLAGLSWPVWKAGAFPSPEPLLLAGVAAYLYGQSIEGTSPRASLVVRALMLLGLPWTHATGGIVAAGLAMGDVVCGRLGRERMGRTTIGILLLGALTGIGSVIVVWNGLYHGHWWAGGYAQYGWQQQNPRGLTLLEAVRVQAEAAIVGSPAVLAVLATAALRRLRPPARAIGVALGVTLALAPLFLRFTPPEPARRLAPLWLCWAYVAGLVWEQLAWPHAVRLAVVAVQGLAAFREFFTAWGRHLEGPGGLFYPNVLWIQWAILGRTTAALAATSLLVIALGWAGMRVSRGLR